MDVQTDFKSLFADALKKSVGEDLWTEEMERLIEQPKNSAYGDLSFPCFQLAKHFRKPPQEIAAKLANAIHDPAFEKVEALGPYVNAFFDRKSFGSRVVNRILREKGNYGSWSFGEGKNDRPGLFLAEYCQAFFHGAFAFDGHRQRIGKYL
ncbi:Arginyl-tRNA synthetase [Caldibacillus debilis]|uniref:Arginyl-tRNA synthetase n=1 Tax=Caldibacillus debilis TaxID=301148 RepID=A0A150M2Z3_9BACI|nr:Arginyl-tRNA synthetase [Caldibacillus debilis]